MSTAELKNRLKEKIEALNEDYLLEHLIDIIEVETSEEVYLMPEAHKDSIDKGLAQIKVGDSFTNEEVLERVKRWADK